MYLRTSSRRNRDGSTVRYVSIAHNERNPGGPSVARVLLPLGREDRLDVAGLRRLVGSINRYLGEDAGSDAGAQVGAEPGGGLTITESRPAGGAWLLDGLWQQLGIGAALREGSGVAGSALTWSGCSLRWWPTGPWLRPASWPPRTGAARTWRSRGWPGWMRTRPTGRWICWSRPTPTPVRSPGCRRRCS